MPNTQFFTDSTSDLPHAFLVENQIKSIGLPFQLDGKEYICTSDPKDPNYIPLEMFYERMRQGSEPTTSMINQQTYLEVFEPVLAEGRDVFYIAFTSGLSGSCTNAQLAALELEKKYPGRRVRVVDSLSGSLGEGLVVYLAIEKHREGLDDDALELYINGIKGKVHHWFTVDDLVYLKRSGRTSGLSAAFGTLLSIKPVIIFTDDGHMVLRDRARGRKKSLNMLVEGMAANVSLPYTKPVFISHADALADAEHVAGLVKERFGVEVRMINILSPTTGAHSGPGTVALFFVGDQPRG